VEVRYAGSWRFEAASADLWAALATTERYATWWPWLRDEELPELATGEHARFRVAAPSGYSLRLELDLDQVVAGERVVATIHGDLEGTAELRLRPVDRGATDIVLWWDVEVRRPLMRAIGLVAQRVLESGHERVVRMGLEAFADAHGIDVAELPSSRPVLDVHDGLAQVIADGIVAGVVAGAVSGLPSTVAALGDRTSLVASTRAAGSLLGADTLGRGVLAHSVVSIGWGVVLSGLWRRRTSRSAWAVGATAGLAIAALDLGVVARRRYPRIAALDRGPQVVDHVAFGVVAAAVLAARGGRPSPR
jgi:hypothetical protein